MPNKSGTLKVAVIGLGFGTDVHVPAFQRLAGIEVTALCGRDFVKTQEKARQLGISHHFTNPVEMMEKIQPQIISLAVPGPVQEELLPELLRRKIAVLAEKPLGMNSLNLRAFVNEFHSQRIPAMIDFEFIKLPAFQSARKHLLRRSGELRSIQIQWRTSTYMNRNRLTSWKTDSVKGGGVLALFGSHALYHLEWFGGRIEGFSAKLGKHQNDPRSTETTLNMNGTFESKASFELSIDTDFDGTPIHEFVFQTTAAQSFLRNLGKDYVSGFQFNTTELPIVSSEDGRILAVAAIAEDLVRWIRTGAPQSPSLEDGYRVQFLSQLVRESSNNNGKHMRVTSHA